ncbi:MAG: GGDEF domain-containing protein [Phycisphaerales bacterium]|nr:MAG: GGDEF domain-containing protein [Phycisphaerales bacterium]
MTTMRATSDDRGSRSGYRVILVGRTGMEGSLRADAGLELIRVRSAFDAIGELGDPIDHDSPSRSVVIVGPDASPADGRGRSFVQALRLVDAGVSVLRVGRRADGADRGPFDGVVEPSLSPDGLRAMLEGGPRVAAEHAPAPASTEPSVWPGSESLTEGMPIDALVRAAVGAEAKPAHDRVGDEPMVAAILRGQDAMGVGLRLIRERLGVSDVELIPPGEGEPPEHAVGVRWNERVIGHLVSREAARRELQRQAVWLAGWARLGEQRRELEAAAFTDPLTGAWNRRYFDKFLPAAIERTRRNRGSLTVMVFDIDDFKQYNDRYGHAAGDEILAGVVALLRSTIRPTDRVCRIGGDEFAVIFHEPTGPREAASKHPESVYGIAKRFQSQVCARRFPKLGDEAPGTLTISGGLATYPWDGASAEALLERADELALQSKREGKNAITLGKGAVRACGTDADAGGETSRHEGQ